jgi:hypothetical protein
MFEDKKTTLHQLTLSVKEMAEERGMTVCKPAFESGWIVLLPNSCRVVRKDIHDVLKLVLAFDWNIYWEINN